MFQTRDRIAVGLRRGQGGGVGDDFCAVAGGMVEAGLAECGGFAALSDGLRRIGAHRYGADHFDLQAGGAAHAVVEGGVEGGFAEGQAAFERLRGVVAEPGMDAV